MCCRSTGSSLLTSYVNLPQCHAGEADSESWRRPQMGPVALNLVETWDVIRARRNVRAYEDREIAPGDLDRILEAGWRSPSASNRQHWDFVLVTDPGQLLELSTVWTAAGHLAKARAAIVLVLPEPEDERYRTIDHYDLGQATMAMMLAGADLGIGSGHSAVGNQEACRRILGIPPDHLCAYMLALGYPEGRPLQPIAKPNGAHSTKWCTGVTGRRPRQSCRTVFTPAGPGAPGLIVPGR